MWQLIAITGVQYFLARMTKVPQSPLQKHEYFTLTALTWVKEYHRLQSSLQVSLFILSKRFNTQIAETAQRVHIFTVTVTIPDRHQIFLSKMSCITWSTEYPYLTTFIYTKHVYTTYYYNLLPDRLFNSQIVEAAFLFPLFPHEML